MKSIICALDFTKGSDKVLEVASKLARKHKAHLSVLFPYRLLPTQLSDEASTLKTRIVTEAHEKFLVLEKKFDLMGNIQYEFKTEIGFLADRVESFARKKNVDLVVLSEEQAHSINDQRDRTLKEILEELKIKHLIVDKTVAH